MNAAAPFDDECSTARRFLRRTIRARNSETRQRAKTMTSAMTAFGIVVGGTSLLYLLMTRLQNGKRNRGSSSLSSGSDGGQYAGGDGWTISSWFGGGDSASDNSCSSSDGGDSGGGGDCGGGGGSGD
jgi:hypothetical protein